MLTPSYLSGVSSEVVLIFSEVEDEIAGDIARRLAKLGEISETSLYQYEKAVEIGLFRQDVSKILSRTSKVSAKQVKKLMAEAAAKSLGYDDDVYRSIGLAPVPLANSPVLQTILLHGTGSSLQLLQNLTKTTATASTYAYQRLLNKTFIKIISGAYSPTQAISQAIKELASNGITKVAYPSGHSDSIEASVRRAVTTGINQSISKLQIARCGEMGTRLVEVSAHSGARPSHAEWQGRVYALEGATREYPDFYSVTGYGTGEGLCGWNCYHSFYPFFDGLSKRSFSDDPARDAGRNNDDEYERQQKQRYYERKIREAKRECATINEAIKGTTSSEIEATLKDDFTRASVKLKNRERALKDFIADSDMNRDTAREQVGGFDRSVSAKAVWANRKAHNR